MKETIRRKSEWGKKILKTVGKKRPLCWMALLFIGILGLFLGERSYKETCGQLSLGQTRLAGEIVSKTYKESAYGDYWQVVIKDVRMEAQGEKCVLDGKYLCRIRQEKERMPYNGQKILLSGTYAPWEEVTDPGQFDLGKWYRSQGILGQFKNCVILEQEEGYSLLKEGMWQLRECLCQQLCKELGKTDGALISAMLLGEKEELQEESKSLYQRNGISHVLSISGLHLMLLGMGLFSCMKRIFGNNRGVAVICIILMSLYCIFTGNSISTNRATVMFVMMFLAKMLGRSYDSLSALGFCAILQLFSNPCTMESGSFQLSFLAVIGVTSAAPVLQQLFRAEGRLGKSVCVSAGASLVTLPVLLCSYGTCPWYSIFLNLFILPVMSGLLFLSISLVLLLLFKGMAMCLWGQGIFLSVFSFIKIPLIFFIRLILKYMEICCRIFEHMPFQDGYIGCPKRWQIVVYVFLLLAVFSRIGKHSVFCKKMILLSAISILTMCTDRGVEVTMLDVGQGDSIVIRNDNGNIYLSDCGSSTVSQPGKYRLIPFLKYKGYGRIKGIFISHLDEDHCNGILELLSAAKEERIRISYIFLPESVKEIEKDQEKLKKLQQLAADNESRIVYLGRGEEIRDGNIRFLCLHPGEKKEGEKRQQDSNNQSLVLQLSHKDLTMLLTGDVEKEGEEEILAFVDQMGISLRSDVLKAAHHGSSGSGKEEFLAAVKPALTLISCGRDNSYGHPHEETIDRLKKAHSRVVVTTDSGAITIKAGRKIRAEQYLPGK